MLIKLDKCLMGYLMFLILSVVLVAPVYSCVVCFVTNFVDVIGNFS